MINKFIAKPVMVEALQFKGTEESFNEIKAFLDNTFTQGLFESFEKQAVLKIIDNTAFFIEIIDLVLNQNDYLIKGVYGEYFKLPELLFNLLYEKS